MPGLLRWTSRRSWYDDGISSVRVPFDAEGPVTTAHLFVAVQDGAGGRVVVPGEKRSG